MKCKVCGSRVQYGKYCTRCQELKGTPAGDFPPVEQWFLALLFIVLVVLYLLH